MGKLIKVTRASDGEKIIIDSERAEGLLENDTITQGESDLSTLTTMDVYGVEDLDEL